MKNTYTQSVDHVLKTLDTTDTTTVYQTMYIFMGTAEYELNLNVLYQQIMDAVSDFDMANATLNAVLQNLQSEL